MCKQIIILVIISISLFSFGQENQTMKDSLVYQNKQVIGKIGEQTKKSCTSCKTNKILNLFGENYSFKIPVSIIGLNDQQIFQEDFDLLIEKQDQTNAVLKYNHRFSSESFKINLIQTKKHVKVSEICKIETVSYSHEIKPDDFVDIPAILICKSELNQNLTDSNDMEQLTQNSKSKCFHCPASLSVEDCIEWKKENKPFIWKE
jgi:hypothetical protein